MHLLRELSIILIISALGELLRGLLPFPVPAGIYGFIILFFCLCAGIIKPRQVEGVGRFMVDTLQIYLIPSCVEIMVYWDELSRMLPSILLMSVVSTLAVMTAAGKMSDAIMLRKGAAADESDD